MFAVLCYFSTVDIIVVLMMREELH